MTIVSPRGNNTRPTSSKVREALMSSLGAALTEATILDLYAGSGAFSLEALSKGAASVVLVESAPPAVKAIRQNIKEAERRFIAQNLAIPKVKIVTQPVQKSRELLINYAPYHLVWADPPYARAQEFMEFLIDASAHLFAQNAQVFLESDKALESAVKMFANEQSGWTLINQRAYGNTMVHRLQYGEGSLDE